MSVVPARQSQESKVYGVGDVELEVRKSNTASAKSSGRRNGKITLHNVFYAPDLPNNILEGCITVDYGIIWTIQALGAGSPIALPVRQLRCWTNQCCPSYG